MARDENYPLVTRLWSHDSLRSVNRSRYLLILFIIVIMIIVCRDSKSGIYPLIPLKIFFFTLTNEQMKYSLQTNSHNIV